MASAASPYDPVSAEDVLTMQFTLIKKGGYDSQEVDGFLDRVAATLDRYRDQLPENALDGDDVRSIEFSMVKRGGYATREVDDLLDRVVAVLSDVSQDPAIPAPVGSPASDVFENLDFDITADPAPASDEPEVAESVSAGESVFDDGPAEPELESPVAPPPAAVAAPLVPVAAAPGPAAPGAPQLHDPGGAAQKLLAAAQQAADILTADANTYAEKVRSEADEYVAASRNEADEYASATRGEADEHAALVTSSAETQAATIREVAADEARRVAEEARSLLVDEIAGLEARKTNLEFTVDELEASVGSHRAQLLAVLDGLRSRVVEDLGTSDAAPSASEVDAATLVALDDVGSEEDGDDSDEASVHDVPAPVAVADDVGEPAAAVDVVDIDDEHHGADGSDGPTEDAAESVGTSVFDFSEDDTSAADSAGELLEDDGAAPPDDASAGGLFDIEAEVVDKSNRSSGAPEATPSGESFFDELRQADDDGGLGPLDDDTDAALSAFFDSEEEPTEGRWRDRFGPGKG